jgi:hypothetical protein
MEQKDDKNYILYLYMAQTTVITDENIRAT